MFLPNGFKSCWVILISKYGKDQWDQGLPVSRFERRHTRLYYPGPFREMRNIAFDEQTKGTTICPIEGKYQLGQATYRTGWSKRVFAQQLIKSANLDFSG